MSQKTPASEQKSIPWKQIHVPVGRNVRSDLPDIEELGENMKEHGQITPIVVRNGGSDEQPFTLVAGARRMAAFKHNGWQARDVLCVIREYKKGDVLGPIADNWIENSQRVDVSFIDQANWVHQLVTGNYPVDEGEVAEPIEKKEICDRLGITQNYLNKMLRSFEKIDPAVAEKAKEADAPARLILALSQVEGKGATKEAKVESRAAKQDELVEEYKAAQKALEAQGRSRSIRSDKGKGGKNRSSSRDEPEEMGLIRLSRKLDDKGYSAEDYLAVLEHKQNTTKGADNAYYAGMHDILRWLTGDVKRCPQIVAADFAVLEPEEEVEE